jgi:hypothetical protein
MDKRKCRTPAVDSGHIDLNDPGLGKTGQTAAGGAFGGPVRGDPQKSNGTTHRIKLYNNAPSNPAASEIVNCSHLLRCAIRNARLDERRVAIELPESHRYSLFELCWMH